MGLKLAAMMAVLMVAMGGLGYWYYTDTQEKMRIYAENQAKLEGAVQQQKQVIAQTKADLKRSSELTKKVQADLARSRQTVELMDKKFNKVSKLLGARDIGKMSAAKPKVLERIINKGSKDTLRCFEILSGVPLKEKEVNADRKSQANRTCPGVANPNIRMQ
tara:strand:- start:8499 stop:8984 length:486 start_codon:yes stop_codon:yes gene_type:complete